MVTAKRIVLAPWQLSSLADNRLALVVVPCKVQPKWKYPGNYQRGGTVFHYTDRYRNSPPTGWGITVGWGASAEFHSFGEPPFSPGDTLFVAEAWCHTIAMSGRGFVVAYRHDHTGRAVVCDNEGEGDSVGIGDVQEPWIDKKHRWRSATTMPAWAARHRLRVVGVEARRVHSITEDEVKACGVYSVVIAVPPPTHVETRWVAPGVTMTNCYGERDDHAAAHRTAKEAFECLWDARHGKRHPWSSNPWAWFFHVEIQRR